MEEKIQRAQNKAVDTSKSYADALSEAQRITIMQAIKDQATQDAKAWNSAINIAVKDLVTTYKLNALYEIISNQINSAIAKLIDDYQLQKP